MVVSGIILTDPINVIELEVLKAMRTELNKMVPGLIYDIKTDLHNMIKALYKNTTTYQSLVGGDLMANFGLNKEGIHDRIEAIIDKLADSLDVKFTRFSISGGNIRGGINIVAIQSDMLDLLSLIEAYVETDIGQVLPWLSWLLQRGDAIIITGYDIAYGRYVQSRSGMAIMKKNNIGFWRVPANESGTITDNWITRTLDNATSYLDQRMSDILEYHLGK